MAKGMMQIVGTESPYNDIGRKELEIGLLVDEPYTDKIDPRASIMNNLDEQSIKLITRSNDGQFSLSSQAFKNGLMSVKSTAQMMSS